MAHAAKAEFRRIAAQEAGAQAKVAAGGAAAQAAGGTAADKKDAALAAERLGIRPAKPGSANWDKYIDMDGEKIKEKLSHPVLSGGAPVQAAGEAQFEGGGGQYFGLEIDAHSGHFFKPGDPFWAPGGGAEQLGKEMFEAAGVMFG